MSIYSYLIHIFYEDTDAAGIVYYANYLKFFERARTQWLHTLEIYQSRLLQQNIAFVVRHTSVDYHRVAQLDDEIIVHIDSIVIKYASLIFYQTIVLGDGTKIASAQVTVACISTDTMKPIAIPVTIKGVLQHACTAFNL